MVGSPEMEKRKEDCSSGVSEMIGAVLLVSLVVLAVGIISVVLLSQPSPKEIPNVHFITGTNQTTLFLYHDGGDPLAEGQFYLMIDGTEIDPNRDWSLGDLPLEVQLADLPPCGLPQNECPRNIQIVYTGSGSGTVLLDQAELYPVVTSALQPDVTIAIPPVTPEQGCEICDWLVDNCTSEQIINAATDVIARNRIILTKVHSDTFREPGGTYRPFFNFTVNATYPRQGPNVSSNIAMGDCSNPTIYQLHPGDKVSIEFLDAPSFFVTYGISPQIWEISAGLGSDIRVYINGQVKNAGSALCHCWISEYKDLHSTLIIEGYNTASNGEMTTLIVNNTSYINNRDKKTITLTNVRPLPEGMFLISAGTVGQSPVYFIGDADQILFNGVEQHLG